jgi:hypothetical protein
MKFLNLSGTQLSGFMYGNMIAYSHMYTAIATHHDVTYQKGPYQNWPAPPLNF